MQQCQAKTPVRLLADSMKGASNELLQRQASQLHEVCSTTLLSLESGKIGGIWDMRQLQRLTAAVYETAQRRSRLMDARVGLHDGRIPGEASAAHQTAEALSIVMDVVQLFSDCGETNILDADTLKEAFRQIVEILKPIAGAPVRRRESVSLRAAAG